MASATSPSYSESAADGPVLNLMNKRLRGLRKKYNRILQMEASLAQGKTLNKEQEEVMRSRAGVLALIDEYEKLRSPLAAAVQEELVLAGFSTSSSSRGNPNSFTVGTEDASSSFDSVVEGLLALAYFGCLFDVKPQSEFTSMMLMRTHERVCCLTYDYVTDDSTELLGEQDLDMISSLGGLLTSRPLYSGISHQRAFQNCLHHAKLWLQGAHEAIVADSSVTYASLRDKLNKIMASDFFTATPEMKAPVDVAAAVSKYNASCQALVSDHLEEPAPDIQIDALHIDYHQQEEDEEDIQAFEVEHHQTASTYDIHKDETDVSDTTGDTTAKPQEQQAHEDFDHNQTDFDQKDPQYIPRRPHPHQRDRGGTGLGRRGYPTPRGRNGRSSSGGGYLNGRNQSYDPPGYHPRSYYNAKGRGGGPGAPSNGSHGPTNVELDTSA